MAADGHRQDEDTNFQMASFYNMCTELQESMVYRMDMRSVLNLEESMKKKLGGDVEEDLEKHRGTLRVSEDRKNYVRYLDENFGNGVELFKHMCEYFVYLSGSRSAEFFSPGSAKPDSDWDFYLPDYRDMHLGFMEKLETIGVRFYTSQQLLEQLVAGDRSTVYLSLKQAKDVNTKPFQGLGPLFGPCVLKVVNGLVQVESRSHEDAYLLGVHNFVVHGFLPKEEGRVPVQLIVENRSHLLCPQSVFSFHSSCVQSFIGCAGAIHLYGDSACNCVSYTWSKNKVTGPTERKRHYSKEETFPSQEKLNAMNAKWQGRGFSARTLDMSSTETVVRRVSSDAMIVRLDVPSGVPDALKKWYEACVDGMMWYELKDSTVPLPPAQTWMDDCSAFIYSWVSGVLEKA